MSTLTPLIEAWDEAYREFAIALDGVPDEDLWKRAHPRLLSVGELAGHIAYGQITHLLTDGTKEFDLSQVPIHSPLIDHAFRYYLYSVDQPVVLDLTTTQVAEEVAKVHTAVKAYLADKNKEDPHPKWGTLNNLVQYQVFHVAYHTGQAYSVRHMLGHEPEDN